MSLLTSLFLVKISGFSIISSVLSYAKMNVRVLGILISLEALMLSLLVMFFGSLTYVGVDSHYFLVLLTFAACEAALGLSLLVSILRLRSNDYIHSLNSLNFYV